MKITITPLSNSAAAKGYYDVVSAATRGGAVAREHYVSSPPRMLEVGLDGTLRITILRPGEVSLALDGISPRDGRAIASNPCRPRRSATDVTINLDKTISTFRRAAILAGNYVIVSLIEEAIAQTVASLWLHVQSLRLVLARAGAGGLDLQPSLSIYILDLPHPVSRSDDPQDHRHNLLLNAGHHPGRGLSTIEASLLVQNKLYLEFCLCSELAGRLRTAGIPCEVSGPARLSISGIPHTVTQMWSTRRSEILLASSGLAVGAAPAGQAPHPFTDLAANRFATRRRREARDRAARTTRREKAALPDEVALRRRHCDDLASLNLTPLDLVKGVMNSALGDHPTLGLPDSLALFERSSVASTRTVRTHVASVSCLLGLSMVEINEATHQLIKELTLLGVDRGGEAYFSTPSIIEDERQVHRLLRTSSPAPRQREDLRVGPGDQARAETLARPPQGGADGSPLTSSPRTTIIPIASWNDASQFLGRCAAGVPPAAGSLVVLSSTGNLGRSGVVDIAKACSRHSLTLDTGGAGGSYQSYVSVLDAWRSPDKVDRFATPVIPWQQRAQAHLIAHDAPALLAEYADHGQWISPGAGSDTIEQMAGDFVSRATEGTRPLLLAEEHEAVHRLNSLVRVALSHRGLLDARSTAIETWHLCGNAFERRQMELCPGEPIIVWPEGQERRSWPQTGRLCTVTEIKREGEQVRLALGHANGRGTVLNVLGAGGSSTSGRGDTVRLQHAYAIPLHSSRDHHAETAMVYGAAGLDRASARLALTRHWRDAHVYWDRARIAQRLADQGIVATKSAERRHVLSMAAVDRLPTSVGAFAADFGNWLAGGALNEGPSWRQTGGAGGLIAKLKSASVEPGAADGSAVMALCRLGRHAPSAKRHESSKTVHPTAQKLVRLIRENVMVFPPAVRPRRATPAESSPLICLSSASDLARLENQKRLVTLQALARPGGVAAFQGMISTLIPAHSHRAARGETLPPGQFLEETDRRRRALDTALASASPELARAVDHLLLGARSAEAPLTAAAWARSGLPTGPAGGPPARREPIDQPLDLHVPSSRSRRSTSPKRPGIPATLRPLVTRIRTAISVGVLVRVARLTLPGWRREAIRVSRVGSAPVQVETPEQRERR